MSGSSKEYQQQYRDRMKMEVLTAYGGSPPKCMCCGNDYLMHLTIDHIDGNGSEHRKTTSISRFYNWLKKEGWPPGFQVLCFNCNYAKHRLGRCGCQDVQTPG